MEQDLKDDSNLGEDLSLENLEKNLENKKQRRQAVLANAMEENCLDVCSVSNNSEKRTGSKPITTPTVSQNLKNQNNNTIPSSQNPSLVKHKSVEEICVYSDDSKSLKSLNDPHPKPKTSIVNTQGFYKMNPT